MRVKKLIGCVALIAALLVGCNRGQGDKNFHLTTSSAPAGGNPPASTAPPSAAPGISYADVVSRVAPAVVTIHSFDDFSASACNRRRLSERDRRWVRA